MTADTEEMVTVPRRLVESIVEDAEAFISDLWECREHYPSQQAKYDRDMADIRELRALLARQAREGRGMREERLRLYVCGCLQMRQTGKDYDIQPHSYVTLARTDGEAMGYMVAQAMAKYPGHAIHAARVAAVDDAMVLAAAQEARRDE